MLSFTFQGMDSYLDFGVVMSTRPILPSPKRRVNYIEVPGRHSRLVFDEETYEDLTIAVECTIKDRENLALKMDGIKSWLFGAGESDLIFSFQSDKKYKAQVVNAIDFTQVLKYTSRFLILFNCKPFKYAVQNHALTISANDTTITNPGTIESEPIISVYGQGDIVLMIEGTRVELKEITSKIILNSMLQDAYDDLYYNLNGKVNGEFPIFKPGQNRVQWTGNVEKL